MCSVELYPLAASGTRITIHLLHALRQAGKRYGLGSACIGGGQGAAVIVSSHVLAMVEDICTHVLILDGGKSRFQGRLEQLKSQFVEDQMNSTLD